MYDLDAIITGICVGVSMLLINTIVLIITRNARKAKKEVQTTMENRAKIAELERMTNETKELVKLTLGTCIILGDGMIQNGINGDFKKAFCEKKQDALKML